MNQSNRAGGVAVRLFLYIFVVWAALLLAQSLGGGLSDILTNLTAALENPFAVRWTDHSLMQCHLDKGPRGAGASTIVQGSRGPGRIGDAFRRESLENGKNGHDK